MNIQIPDERSLAETDIQSVIDVSSFGKKNVILDSQILTSLMGCPRLADFRFNHNLISLDGKSNSLECGSIVHVFMEYFYGGIINGLKREQAVQQGFAMAETFIKGCPHCTDFIPSEEFSKPPCGHKVNEFPGVKNTPRDSEREPFTRTGWQWVLDTCDQYQRFYINDHWVPLEVETVHGVVLYEDDEIRILWKAKLDAMFDMNQGIHAVDHKTMKQTRNTISLNNQFIGQCLVTKTCRIFLNKVGFQITLKPEEKFLRPPVNYSLPRLIEWQTETLPYYAKLLLMYAETGHFPPNYEKCESRYGNCAFIKVCEGDPLDRERIIKELFVVGPEWNPSNDKDE